MSTASTVPETFELEGDDAIRTLRVTGTVRLLRNAFTRFRAGDGFSHARALAFAVTLTFLPLTIAFVGFATVLGQDQLTDAVISTVENVAPGPAAQIFTQAFEQGRAAGGGNTTALVLGLVTTLITATTAMAQVERGANRIYGIDADRQTIAKYRHGLVLTCSAGVLLMLALTLLVSGPLVAEAFGLEDALATAWAVVRWPLGILLAVVGFALLFERAPHRRQPEVSWLAVGSAISLVLWLVFTGLLAIYLTASQGFGQTYGPLAGVIGFLLWAFLGSVALFVGLAVAAQLEAVRAGVLTPDTGLARQSWERPRAAGVG